jgi:hypothetical protein
MKALVERSIEVSSPLDGGYFARLGQRRSGMGRSVGDVRLKEHG